MKIEIDRTVVQRALDALMGIDRADDYKDFLTLDELESISSAMLALREALAAPQNQLDDISVADMAAPQTAQQEPVGTVTSYLTHDGHTKWAFQPEKHAWGIRQDQLALDRGALSVFDVYVTQQPAPDARLAESMSVARQRIAELEAEIQDMDRLMRASVPDRWKACKSPVGAVQSYIAEMEEQLEQQLAAQNQLDDINVADMSEPEPQPAQQDSRQPEAQSAYDVIDSFLRNNLCDGDYENYSRALEALYTAPQPAPQQDPDALHLAAMDLARKQAQRIEELEQQLAALVPLTNERIMHFFDTHVGFPSPSFPLEEIDWINFARAIETAHGITKGTK